MEIKYLISIKIYKGGKMTNKKERIGIKTGVITKIIESINMTRHEGYGSGDGNGRECEG
jgi:hypothetical protein